MCISSIYLHEFELNPLEMNGISYPYYLSRDMRKPDFCICENKDADQLSGYREADQCLCFRHLDSTIPLHSKSRNFKSQAIFCGCTARFVSDLVGIPKDLFSDIEAHLYVSNFVFKGIRSKSAFFISFLMKIMQTNTIAPDKGSLPHFVTSHLGLISVCPCPIKRMQGLYGLILKPFNEAKQKLIQH